MSGYTPVFETIYNGTLYGRWPSAAVWASLLPLCDKHGVIAYSWTALASMTGWPMDLLRQGIDELMQPDPGSNSPLEQGKRLLPHDQREGKDWGWKAVNHLKYREKARKQQHDEQRQSSGENAQRMSARKEETREDPRGPARTREDPLSYTNTNTNTNTGRRAEALVLHASLPRDSWEEWLAHRREKRLSMSPRALKKQLKLLAEYPETVQREIIDTSINAGWEGLFRPKGKIQTTSASEWR
jgi:hypothetical protein